jgi:hypothetical protein
MDEANDRWLIGQVVDGTDQECGLAAGMINQGRLCRVETSSNDPVQRVKSCGHTDQTAWQLANGLSSSVAAERQLSARARRATPDPMTEEVSTSTR